MIKLIIFDLDGTLVNSLGDLCDATNKALAEFGCQQHPEEKYNYFVGDGTLLLIERALPQDKRCESIINTVHERFSQIYRENYAVRTKPYSLITEVLKELSAQGVKLAVASNKPDEFTKRIVAEMFEQNTFFMVCGKRDGVEKKPNPTLALEIMKNAHALPKETLFVGDTNVDIKTGHNAGVKTIGCLWGFREAVELRDAGADYIISNPQEIVKIVNNLK